MSLEQLFEVQLRSEPEAEVQEEFDESHGPATRSWSTGRK